jgi:hypothetical protein
MYAHIVTDVNQLVKSIPAIDFKAMPFLIKELVITTGREYKRSPLLQVVGGVEVQVFIMHPTT